MEAGIYTVDELAYGCSDFGEHVTKIIDELNLGNKVDEVHAGTILIEVLTDSDEEFVIKHSASMSVNTPISVDFADKIDEYTKETSENLARRYKGKYDV